MNDPLRHVKPACRAARAYTLATRPHVAVKANQNENPWDLPEALKQRVLEHALARPWSRYPDFDAVELRERLAAFAGWRPDGVLVGNGSNELIEATMVACVGTGTRVVIPEPTFALYGLLTQLLGGERVPVRLGPDFAYDGAALLRARRASGAALTLVCSPNNPTGSVLELDDLRRLCADGDELVVMDEAYHEFAGVSAVPLLHEHDNLIVLRTFSKAMGLAGLRVGYLLASPALTREIDKARLPYNVNFFSKAAALAALDAAGLLEERARRLVALRERLAAELAGVPGVRRVFPSRANFLLFELERVAPPALFEALSARGVLLRDVSGGPRLERCLRVSVGTEEENALILAALREALRELDVRAEARV